MLITNRRYNPLLLPSGTRRAGFDPTHPASATMNKNRGFSVLAAGNNFINLLTAVRGTLTATPATGPINPVIGPNVGFTFASSNSVRFSGFVTTASSLATFATIWFTPSIATTSSILVGTSAATNFSCGYNTSGQLFMWNSSALLTWATTTVAINTPYFTIWTLSSAAYNILQLNLLTGKVLTTTASNLVTIPASNGSYDISGSSNSSFGTSNIAAAMYAPSFMSIPAMRAWAADPWAFWYPPTRDNVISLSMRASQVVDVLSPQIWM